MPLFLLGGLLLDLFVWIFISSTVLTAFSRKLFYVMIMNISSLLKLSTPNPTLSLSFSLNKTQNFLVNCHELNQFYLYFFLAYNQFIHGAYSFSWVINFLWFTYWSNFLMLYLCEASVSYIIFCYLNWQVSMGYGTITSHALMSLEARGTLFVTPGTEVVTYITSSTYRYLFLCILFPLCCYRYGISRFPIFHCHYKILSILLNAQYGWALSSLSPLSHWE